MLLTTGIMATIVREYRTTGPLSSLHSIGWSSPNRLEMALSEIWIELREMVISDLNLPVEREDPNPVCSVVYQRLALCAYKVYCEWKPFAFALVGRPYRMDSLENGIRNLEISGTTQSLTQLISVSPYPNE